MAKRKVAFRKNKQNRFAMFLVTAIVLMLLCVVGYKSFELSQKQKEYTAREQALEEQIANEEERSKEIEEFRKYTKTKMYIAEVAKDKLGLVNDGEIIFKEKD